MMSEEDPLRKNNSDKGYNFLDKSKTHHTCNFGYLIKFFSAEIGLGG